jgi:thioredoxin-related protein
VSGFKNSIFFQLLENQIIMQYLTVIAIAAATGLIGLAAQFSKTNPDQAANEAHGKWYTWEEAVELNKTKPKKIVVDIYTDWCGWCKKMDKGAFSDSKVSEYIGDNFYAVKLNAEQRDQIIFGRDTFSFVETAKGKGVHTLAYALLDGKMSYPTLVYLDQDFRRIMVSPGYKETHDLMKELKFAKEEVYNQKTWEEYKEKGK